VAFGCHQSRGDSPSLRSEDIYHDPTGTAGRILGSAKLFSDVVFVSRVRRSYLLELRKPVNLFQPHNDTALDRYPEVFDFLRGQIGERPDVRLPSFGCWIGDEVFFPSASITGIDISAGHIRDCRRRQRGEGDNLMCFRHASSAEDEPSRYPTGCNCQAARASSVSARWPQAVSSS
jgi:hypothetical protein